MEFLFRDKFSDLDYSDKLYGFINNYDNANAYDKKRILDSLIINNSQDNDNNEDEGIEIINRAIGL
jgi:hypothetical protein